MSKAATKYDALFAPRDPDELDFAASADRLTTIAARIIALLQASPDGATLIEIRASCSISAGDGIAVMTALVREGRVRQEGRGVQALYSLIASITEPANKTESPTCGATTRGLAITRRVEALGQLAAALAQLVAAVALVLETEIAQERERE